MSVLYTSRWHLMRDLSPGVIVPVRTSIGTARFIVGARRFPAIEELMPVGLLDLQDRAVFTRRYRERLEEHGVARIQARFDELHEGYPGRPLVLLCFEADRRDCHRGDFADWWEEKAGVAVPELTAATLYDLAAAALAERARDPAARDDDGFRG